MLPKMRIREDGHTPLVSILPPEMAAAMARKNVLWQPEVKEHDAHIGRYAETLSKKVGFLQAFAVCGAVGTSCDLVGISRGTYNSWRGVGLKEEQLRPDQKEFRELLQEAQERLTEMLEREATRRAMKKSDPLMVLLLRAKKPELYGAKKQVDVNHRLDLESIVDRSMKKTIDVRPEDVKVLPTPKKEA